MSRVKRTPPNGSAPRHLYKVGIYHRGRTFIVCRLQARVRDRPLQTYICSAHDIDNLHYSAVVMPVLANAVVCKVSKAGRRVHWSTTDSLRSTSRAAVSGLTVGRTLSVTHTQVMMSHDAFLRSAEVVAVSLMAPHVRGVYEARLPLAAEVQLLCIPLAWIVGISMLCICECISILVGQTDYCFGETIAPLVNA